MTEVLEWLPLNRDEDSCFCSGGRAGRLSASGDGCCGTIGVGLTTAGFGASGAGGCGAYNKRLIDDCQLISNLHT